MLMGVAVMHRPADQLLLQGVTLQSGVDSTSDVLMCCLSTCRRHDAEARQWCVSDEQVRLTGSDSM